MGSKEKMCGGGFGWIRGDPRKAVGSRRIRRENPGETGRNGDKWGDSDERGVPYSTGGASGSASWLLEFTRLGLFLIETCKFYSSS